MLKNHGDDAALVAALKHANEPARRCFEHYANQERLGIWLEKPSPDLNEISQPIKVAMGTHEIFRQDVNRFFGSKQFILNPANQSQNILRISVERGPEAAIAWYYKLHSTDVADIRYVAEVYGLNVSDVVKLGNGVSLIPLDKLPSSANARAVQSQFQHRPGRMMHIPWFAVGATYENSSIIGSSQFDDGEERSPRSRTLETTIAAFTLVDKASPVIGTSWTEFVDDDLNEADFGRMSMMPVYEGRPSMDVVDVNEDAIEWVERYVALSAEVREHCDIALARLNLARRRFSPGDKAIDGGICLEALLGDANGQEITYKLRLRAALFLSKDRDTRRRISDIVKDFYGLRSKAVHGDRIKPKNVQKNRTCAEEGLDICAQVVREMVRRGEKFIPESWELTGGKPDAQEPSPRSKSIGRTLATLLSLWR